MSHVRPSVLPKAAAAAAASQVVPLSSSTSYVGSVPQWSRNEHNSSVYFGDEITIIERSAISLSSADAIAIRTCREIEGVYCDRVAATFNKPVLHVLDAAQLQELALGLEMTGLPFLMAVKPPVGCTSLEELLPEGYNDRVSGRGVVHGGWVQQQQILAHPSLGCFVTHCGSSSIWEGLVSETQLVLFPQLADQTIYAKLMADELKVGVKVERQQNGWMTKQSLCEAIKKVMDEDSDISHVVRKNHAKYTSMLISPGFITGYIDNFIKDLQALIS
ncbi:hypothetical protein SOVF_000010 [Spinacia oleracea]|nr:hypothetical protein SOVF_000010 [Spinacia oleracea]